MYGELHFSSVPRFGSFYSSTKNNSSELQEKDVPCMPRNTMQTVLHEAKGIRTTAFLYHLQIRHNYVILRFKIDLE